MVYSSSATAAGVDYTLGLNLKGTTVSVLLNNQLVLSKTYNAVVTDGNFGLFSRSGETSFDSVTFKSDDPALAGASHLRAAEQGTGESVTLSANALAPSVAEVIRRWEAAIDPTQAALLDDATVVISDLPEGILGQVMGSTIFIDIDASGNGWYIDPTPSDDIEFVDGGTARPVSISFRWLRMRWGMSWGLKI